MRFNFHMLRATESSVPFCPVVRFVDRMSMPESPDRHSRAGPQCSYSRLKQLPLALRDGPVPDFAGYIQGSNAAAFEHLQRVAGLHRSSFRAEPQAPLYLWGPSGSGKTHLLHALASAFEEQGGRVGWFTSNDRASWIHDESWSLIVLDDCDAYDAAQQQYAFRAFVEAATQGATVVAAGRLPPVDLPLRDDLRSRLGWGLVFNLQPLSEADVRLVMERDARRRGLELSSEVVSYLLTHFQRDLKNLMAMLDRLDDFALATHRGMTVPLLKQMLAEESP
ncbi:DnaA regulatory inactivator Hda [soil metagenome]